MSKSASKDDLTTARRLCSGRDSGVAPMAVRALISGRRKRTVYLTAANYFQRDQVLNPSHHREFVLQLLSEHIELQGNLGVASKFPWSMKCICQHGFVCPEV